MSDHVFISYSHTDADFVAILKEQLVNAGIEPKIDTDFLHQEIDDRIHSAFAVLP